MSIRGRTDSCIRRKKKYNPKHNSNEIMCNAKTIADGLLGQRGGSEAFTRVHSVG